MVSCGYEAGYRVKQTLDVATEKDWTVQRKIGSALVTKTFDLVILIYQVNLQWITKPLNFVAELC